jgi:succinate dehydrogenase / fumarate reductase flavoprotein subunit
MSESLRNDGRVWVPKKTGDTRPPDQIPEEERDYFLERKYPAFGNLVPRDIASRSAQEVCDEGRGVGVTGYAVYLDFAEPIERLGEKVIRERYGNLFDMYEEITAENPYRVPMRIYPAPHYTMGGLWVDYNLMSTIPGLFVLGEANFSDHGANRLGASALMQGLCDGYFIIPYTLGDYLAQGALNKVTPEHPAFSEETGRVRERIERMLSIGGKRTAQEIHRDLGALMIREVGMSRSEPGLKRAIEGIRELREEFWKNVRIPSNPATLHKHLEIAGRVSDYLELAELMAMDALARNESCGGHFRIEFQTPEGEARRDDENQTHVSVWEYRGDGIAPEMHKEALTFEAVHPSQRSYK